MDPFNEDTSGYDSDPSIDPVTGRCKRWRYHTPTLGSQLEPYNGPIAESVSLPPPGTTLPFPVPVAGPSPKMAPPKHIPVVDPPISATGHLPWPLGKVCALPHPRPKTEWYDTCALNEPWFIEILELTRVTDGENRTC
jgi:hypothetical protein